MQKQINDLLLVSVPETSCDYQLISIDNRVHLKYSYEKYNPNLYILELENISCEFNIPKAEIVAAYPGIIEYMAGQFVKINGSCNTALESFASLMQANGVYLVNPFGKKPNYFDFDSYGDKENPEYLRALNKWQTAQETTSAKFVVLQIIK